MKAIIPEHDVIYQNDNFLIDSYNYNIQFFPYYNARLRSIKDSLIKNAHQTWPDIAIHSINDLADKKQEDSEESEQTEDTDESSIDEEILNGKEVIIIGTLFKKMPSQPNILKELDNDKKMIAEEKCSNFVSDYDILYLQEGDESIELKGDIKIDRLCTGICVAVKGHLNPNGSGFIVEDICFALTDHKPEPMERPLGVNDYYVAIVSGLGFSKNMAKNQNLSRSLNILFDILTGNSSLVVDKPIVNLVVAGNSIGINARNQEMNIEQDKTPTWNKTVQSFTVDAIKLLDKFYANVGQFMFVDVMPGLLDPSTYLWPQQPLHPCLLPNSHRLSTIRSVPNPHRATYFGVDMLGTSGQNVDSIRSCSTLTDTIEIMRNILDWGHIAPTCPDLLHGYPFTEKDPLVIDEYPDIFFVGNQAEFGVGSFQSSKGKTVQLISVPVFEDKTMAILINLRTLQCEMIAFN